MAPDRLLKLLTN